MFFLQEGLHHSWGESIMAFRTLESVSGARVMKTKQFVPFMTSCRPIVEDLEASVTNPEPIAFATSVCHITRAVDNVEAGPIVEEECLVQQHAHESGPTSDDEATGLPLDPKMVADAIKEELMFMRKLQVYHEVPVSYLDNCRWVYTNKGLRIHSSEPDWLREKPRQ